MVPPFIRRSMSEPRFFVKYLWGDTPFGTKVVGEYAGE